MKKVWLLFREHTLESGSQGPEFYGVFSTMLKAEKARDTHNAVEGFHIKETGESVEFFVIESKVN